MIKFKAAEMYNFVCNVDEGSTKMSKRPLSSCVQDCQQVFSMQCSGSCAEQVMPIILQGLSIFALLIQVCDSFEFARNHLCTFLLLLHNNLGDYLNLLIKWK